jgi:hypothetical protein
MAANPAKALEPENSGGKPMGANTTQAVAVALFLIAFVALAGAFAGGGMLLGILALALLGAGSAFFIKCKPWEHQE